MIYMVLLGALIGILSGMFGFGGSSISTPFLRVLFSVPPLIALGSPLPMTLISSGIATWKYQRVDMIDWSKVKVLLLTMIPGSLIGAYLTKYIDGKTLMLLTAFFLMYVSLRFIFKKSDGKKTIREAWIFYVAGFFIGLLSGLLANGGGILVVPVLVLLGMDIKKAVGTSLAVVLLGVLPAVLVHWYLGHIDWLITLLLTLGVIPCSYLGAKLAITLHAKKLQRYYGAFLILFSTYFLIYELMNL